METKPGSAVLFNPYLNRSRSNQSTSMSRIEDSRVENEPSQKLTSSPKKLKLLGDTKISTKAIPEAREKRAGFFTNFRSVLESRLNSKSNGILGSSGNIGNCTEIIQRLKNKRETRHE